jgi:hypothetical protein
MISLILRMPPRSPACSPPILHPRVSEGGGVAVKKHSRGRGRWPQVLLIHRHGLSHAVVAARQRHDWAAARATTPFRTPQLSWKPTERFLGVVSCMCVHTRSQEHLPGLSRSTQDSFQRSARGLCLFKLLKPRPASKRARASVVITAEITPAIIRRDEIVSTAFNHI